MVPTSGEWLTSRWRRSPLMVLGLALALLLGGCAEEQTAEEREREEVRRESSRLGKAAGSFKGFATVGENRFLPLTVTTTVLSNPEQGDEKPRLRTDLQLGLFGGVLLSTTESSFDFGERRLVARFSASGPAQSGQGFQASGGQLELSAVVQDNGLAAAQLTGPETGTLKLILERGDVAGFFTDQENFSYLFDGDGQLATGATPLEEGIGLLTIKRQEQDQTAPTNSDLDKLPGLSAALRFFGTAIVPNEASSVLYDPLKGSLEINFGSGTQMRFQQLYLSQADAALVGQSPTLQGRLAVGSAIKTEVAAAPVGFNLSDIEDDTNLPPKGFLGTFQAGSGSSPRVTFDAVGTIEYLGRNGQNNTSYAFSDFPALRLTVWACRGGQQWLRREYQLASLDHLAGEALFQLQGQSAGETPDYLKVQYGFDWQKLEGQIIADDGPSSSKDALKLQSVANLSGDGCAATVQESAADRRDDDTLGGNDNIMTYRGYMERSGEHQIPARIQIFPIRDPGGGDDDPALQVTIKLGFFGGVIIASEPAYFDWGTGEIIASFARASGAPLEFRALLTNGPLNNATLLGPNLGINQFRLFENGPDLFDDVETNYYDIVILDEDGNPGSSAGVDGTLALKREEEDTQAPANVDLPSLPSLKASIKIGGLAQTPQVGTKVIYDPLTGELEINMTSSSRVEFNDIFLVKDNSGSDFPYKIAPRLDGKVVLGAAELRDIGAVKTERESDLRALPPPSYVGTFQGRPDTFEFKALAFIDYLGSAGTNTSEFPFPSFPKLRMTVIICVGDQEWSRRRLELKSVDHLNFTTQFDGIEGRNQDDLVAWYTQDWETLSGTFIDPDGDGGVSRDRPQLRLTGTGDSGPQSCRGSRP